MGEYYLRNSINIIKNKPFEFSIWQLSGKPDTP